MKKSLEGIDSIRDLKVDGCPSKEIFFGKSTLLMNTSYIVFPEGDLKVYGIIIASGINSHNSVIRLNELIT